MSIKLKMSINHKALDDKMFFFLNMIDKRIHVAWRWRKFDLKKILKNQWTDIYHFLSWINLARNNFSTYRFFIGSKGICHFIRQGCVTSFWTSLTMNHWVLFIHQLTGPHYVHDRYLLFRFLIYAKVNISSHYLYYLNININIHKL